MNSTPKQLKAQAIRATQDVLAMSPEFFSMPSNEQEALFRDEYQRQLSTLTRQMNPAGSSRGGGSSTPDRASDRIDDQRHENRRIDQAGELAGEFVREVNFPQDRKSVV